LGAQLGDGLAIGLARHRRLDPGGRLEARFQRFAPVELDLAVEDDLLLLRRRWMAAEQKDSGADRNERQTDCNPPNVGSRHAALELGNQFPRRAETLRPILERHGLALISGWYSRRLLERSVDEEIAAVEDHLALLAALGCKVMVFAETTGGIGEDRAAKLSRR